MTKFYVSYCRRRSAPDHSAYEIGVVRRRAHPTYKAIERLVDAREGIAARARELLPHHFMSLYGLESIDELYLCVKKGTAGDRDARVPLRQLKEWIARGARVKQPAAA